MSTHPIERIVEEVRERSRRSIDHAVHRTTDAIGGPARRRVVVVLACVLALDAADKGTVGAVAVQLQQSFHVGYARIGLLVGVTSGIGAIATLPVGALTDRVRRTTLLSASILVWALAMAASGASMSYMTLLLSRVALGAVTATSGPTVASLIGDFFPPRDRSKIYSYILTGELVGAGIGFIGAGGLAGAFGWRGAFFFLAMPAVVLAASVRRYLPEPARGGQSRLEVGDEGITSIEDAEATNPKDPVVQPERSVVRESVEDQRVRPRAHLVLSEDPAAMPMWSAVKYILRIRTNLVLILASGLGYFFFAGLRAFAVTFLRGRYGMGQFSATALLTALGIGAVIGLIVGGRLADRMLINGRTGARIFVGAVAYMAAAFVFMPGILSSTLVMSIPLFLLATMALAAPNAPLDAARLDIMPSRLWGRAEGVRTVLRTTLEAIAPLLFGFVADSLGGGHRQSAVALGGHPSSSLGGHGLEYTFLLMLFPLAISGLVLLRGQRTYPRDVATASASERNLASVDGPS